MRPPLDQALLHRLEGVLSGHPGIRAAAVFGSVAVGRARPDSDLDLYVRLEHGRRWSDARHRQVSLEVSRVSGRETHLVVEVPGRTSVVLRREVAAHGVVVFEARPGAWVELKAAATLAYADLEPSLRRCREGVRRRVLRELGGQGAA